MVDPLDELDPIDRVIERSRQPGKFLERKRFSLARSRGIRKMREFALADPHYYILELIQAALANGARHLDIQVDYRTVVLSYIGGGFAKDELAQLFDYLFASKATYDDRDVRSLAVGINALMSMAPSNITIESGDGTLSGTHRIVISGRNDTVEIGTPDAPLDGTFIRATGLKRFHVDKKSVLIPGGRPKEIAAIETRCMAAPVPFLVNGEAIFGYGRLRSPYLLGYNNVVKFDEGDLYGSIGKPARGGGSFKLLISGVWITSVSPESLSGFGGIIAFDRLRKTVDHSGIVQDEVYDELWIRLRPYLNMVETGGGAPSYDIKSFATSWTLGPQSLRALLMAHPVAVVVPMSAIPSNAAGKRATVIASCLDAVIVRAAPREVETVRTLAGGRTRVVAVDVDDDDDLTFYQQAPCKAPPRPWLTEPIAMDGLAIAGIVEATLGDSHVLKDAREMMQRALGHTDLTAQIYTPAELWSVEGELAVVVTVLDRVAWRGSVPSSHPGHLLQIDIPDGNPSMLAQMAHSEATTCIAQLVGEQIARAADPQLTVAARRVVDSLAYRRIEPGSTAARIVLGAVARHGVVRVIGGTAAPARVGLSLPDRFSGVDLLALPVLQTADGDPISLRDLEDIASRTYGLIYAVPSEAPIDLTGLDRQRILQLSYDDRELLIDLFGEAALAPADRREILAQHGTLHVRNIAVGLVAYPNFPVLVEGDDPSTWPVEAQRAAIADLVAQLSRAASGRLESGVSFESIDRKRAAIRHLIWFAAASPGFVEVVEGVDVETPLFVDEHDRVHPYGAIRSVPQLLMLDGRGVDAVSPDTAVADNLPGVLAMNAFVLHALSAHHSIAGAFDFDVAVDGADPDAPAFAFVLRDEDKQLSFEIGISSQPVLHSSIAVVDPSTQRVRAHRGPAHDLGVVGRVVLLDPALGQTRFELDERLRAAGVQTMRAAIESLARLRDEPARYERVVTTLLKYAARHLRLIVRPSGERAYHATNTLAAEILGVPLFPTASGTPVAATRLLGDRCSGSTAASTFRHTQLAAETPQFLLHWLSTHLDPRRFETTEAATTVRLPPPNVDGPVSHADLAGLVQYWLDALRPDKRPAEDDFPTRVSIRVPPSMHVDPKVETATKYTLPVGWLHHYRPSPEDHLFLNAQHWLVERTARVLAQDRNALAWLLLSSYAHVNAVEHPVTNEHELLFQRRIANVLRDPAWPVANAAKRTNLLPPSEDLG